MSITALGASANKLICWTEGETEREIEREREKQSANVSSA
jgi:hypothetical protein